MKNIISEMIDVVKDSIDSLKLRISDVGFGQYQDGDKYTRIVFKLDNKDYAGELKGRNFDLVLGVGKRCDIAVAARVLLDGDAKPV